MMTRFCYLVYIYICIYIYIFVSLSFCFLSLLIFLLLTFPFTIHRSLSRQFLSATMPMAILYGAFEVIFVGYY